MGKICKKCNALKSDFGKDSRAKDGYQSVCNECCNKRRRERYNSDTVYRQKQLDLQEKYKADCNIRMKKHATELTDTYIIASLVRGTDLTTEDFKDKKDLIILKRLIIQYERKKGKNKKYKRLT